MAISSREARRRRIMDMSSDRLALITGKIKTLPSSSTGSIHSTNEAFSPSISNQYRVSTDSPADNKESSSFSKKPDKIDMPRGVPENQPVTHKPEPEPNLETRPRPLETIISSSKPISFIYKFFSKTKINSAVSSSQTIRFICSIIIAILPVLSFIQIPIPNMIVFRPLYLLLLTNITIVLGKLILNQSGLSRTEQENERVRSMIRRGEYDLAEQISKILELGLVLQNVMGAILIDCSVYSIIVVCGISIARALGF